MFMVKLGPQHTPNKEKMKNLVLILVLFFFYNNKLIADEIKNLNATYTIPTDSQKDLPYSTFNLENYQVSLSTVNNIEEATVTYDLPKLMVGEAQKISMKLIQIEDGIKYLKGSKSTAECMGKWAEMKCDVQFNDISLNLENVYKILKDEGVESREISKRISILLKFSGDPIGVSQVTGKRN